MAYTIGCVFVTTGNAKCASCLGFRVPTTEIMTGVIRDDTNHDVVTTG